jgi:hypothetical protein
MKLRSWWLLSAAVVFAGSGCTQAPVEHTVRKVPSEVPSEVSTEDVRRDAEKAVDTAKDAALQAKKDFELRLKAGLAEMEVEIAKLHEKGHALKDEAGTRWNETMADLKAKQKVARDKLDELGTSTGEAWGHLEKGAQAAWDDVRKALREAAKEF